MKDQSFSPDDPRLTAYALGELNAAESAIVEAALREAPDLQEVVADIRGMAGEVTHALAAEPTPAVTPPLRLEAPGRKVTPFPYFLISGLAAAAFAVLVAVRDDEAREAPAERTIRYEVQLGPPDAPEAAPPVAPGIRSAATEGVSGPGPGGSAATFAPPALPPAPDAFAGRLAVPATESLEQAALAGAGLANVGRDRRDNGQLTASRLSYAAKGAGEAGYFPAPVPAARAPAFAPSTEGYAAFTDNPFLAPREHPLSTFSIDVDTASYANVRRLLNEGRRPPRDAVRIEELLNYFPYQPVPAAADGAPVAVQLEVASAPWAPTHRLVRIGLQAVAAAPAERAPANLVFLLDVSGSMSGPNRLPLVKEAMRLLLTQLRPEDRVAIVTYAGESGLALPSTPVRQQREILATLDRLQPGGATNGAMGIHLAYDVARANFIDHGINRIVLCTDGDFNVGVTSTGDLARLVQDKARTGIHLTALGFGMGNYRDDTLEQLAQRGQGAYGYIDSLREARKLLVEQVEGTLQVAARDVKLQVEFNPAQVQAYRLIGYENRALRPEEFKDDAVDAGEMGVGHTVTALYEVVPAGVEWSRGTGVDDLKYQTTARPAPGAPSEELLTVKLRYKRPAEAVSESREFVLTDRGPGFEAASTDFRFSAAVAGFGLVLRDSAYRGSATLAQVLGWAQGATGNDAGGYRQEFVRLVQRAIEVWGE